MISPDLKPAYDYADNHANADGQALFSCEWVKKLIVRASLPARNEAQIREADYELERSRNADKFSREGY